MVRKLPERARNKRRARPGETPGFVAFYGLFPRKKARPDALKAWLDGACEERADEIMAGLKAQLAEFGRRPMDAVPYPATYLRRDEWKDPPTPAPQQQPRQAVPFAVRAEEDRAQRILDAKVRRITEELRPRESVLSPREQYKASLGGGKWPTQTRWT